MKNQTSIHEYIITISSCFINTNIPFCIAGGIAVSLWGHVRATEDLDVIALIDETHDFLKRCIQNSKLFSVKGINIPVINLEDLIVFTCASGRYQDIADVQALLAGSFPVDRDYIIKQLEALQVTLAPDIQKIILQ